MKPDSSNCLSRRLHRAFGLPGPGCPPDGQLLGRFIGDRDEVAFAELVRRHGPMVLSVCRRVTGNTHDADDAFQATFLVLARKARGLASESVLGAWLHGVAQRAALKARAAAARRRAKEAAAARPEGVAATAEPSDVLAVVEQELGRLPKKYREPLVLCGLCGRPRKEVAEQLGVPEGTLGSRLATAREMLADRLRRRGLVIPAVAVATACDTPAAPAAVPTALAKATTEAAIGKAPAAAARIASEVTRAMFVNKLRFAILAVPAALMIGAAIGAPGRPTDEPIGGPRRELVIASVPPAPAPMDDIPAWKKEFNSVYALKDGEVVKRIAPPFLPCREEFARDGKYIDEDGPFTADDMRMILRWDGKQARNAIITFTVKGPVPPTWFTVDNLLLFSAGPSIRVEGDAGLLKAFVTGDLVVREGAPAEKVVPRLEAILRNECELPVKLRLAEVEREVVVVAGKFASAPREGREKNEIDVFSRRPIPDTRAGGGSGDLARFILGVETFTRRRLVNEVEQPPAGTLSWYFHSRSPATPEEQSEDTDPEAVFKTVAAQTGLTFKTQNRKVPVVFVEKVEK